MKYTELHRKIIKAGWVYVYAVGSHYFYQKDGVISPPIPYHGSKEIGRGLQQQIYKQLGLH